MTAQLIGLGVLALTIGLVVAALELNQRLPRPPAAHRGDADTRRLLTDLGHARDREWQCRPDPFPAQRRHRDELAQLELQSLHQ